MFLKANAVTSLKAQTIGEKLKNAYLKAKKKAKQKNIMEVLRLLPTPRTGLSSFCKSSFYIQFNAFRSKLFRKSIKIHCLTTGKSKRAVSSSCVDLLLIYCTYRA